jgi:3-oxoacyl-[acyl-carrier-protein] synthase-3
MVYAKQIESASELGEIEVPNQFFLNQDLFYKDKSGIFVKKEGLTDEGIIGIHRIERRRWTEQNTAASDLATKTVAKLSVRPQVLMVAHNDWPVPIPAIAGIAQYAQGYSNAAFCDLISNNDLPGPFIAQALVDSGKYNRVVYASSTEISSMRKKHFFDSKKFAKAASVFERCTKPKKLNTDYAPESIDFVIVDHQDMFPSNADIVKSNLDLAGVQTLDVIAGCPGYVMAVDIADALIKTKQFETITCVGAETLEKMADPRYLDITIYGSGAGATTYQASNEPGIVCSYFKGMGDLWHLLRLDAGVPLDDGTPTGPYLVMEGHTVYRVVKRELPKALKALIGKANLDDFKMDLNALIFLLHQMNGKLIEHSLASFLGVRAKTHELKQGKVPPEIKEFIDNQVPLSVQVYGNSSSATIPVTEDHARRGIIRSKFSEKSFEDKLKIGSGTTVLKKSAGAGFIIGGYIEVL